MGLSKLILRIALKIIDILTFFIHSQPNRITFVSLTSDHLTQDFLLLSNALEKEKKYDIHYNLIVFKKNIWGSITYFFNCFKQLIEYKKSALVILNDNNYVISIMKPKHAKVLQIWHAPGAVKKFGNQIKRQYPIRNYDAVIASSPFWTSSFSQAFGVDEKQIYPFGMPRIDDLHDQNKMQKQVRDFFERYPQTKDKYLVLYAPTFRGNIIDGFQIESLDLEHLPEKLDKNVMILYKFHPLLGDIRFENKNAIDVNQEDLYTLMQASHCLVSDYSSVFFDYSCLNKPMIAYVPDLKDYKETIGLNLSFDEDFPGPICKTEEEVIQAINTLDTYDYDRLHRFRNKYITYFDGKNTKRIVDLIDYLLKKHP